MQFQFNFKQAIRVRIERQPADMTMPVHIEHIRNAFSAPVLETHEKDSELATLAEQFALSSTDKCADHAMALAVAYYDGVTKAHLIRDITEVFRSLIKELDIMRAPVRFARALREAVLDHIDKHVTDIVANSRATRAFVDTEVASLRVLDSRVHRHIRHRRTNRGKLQATITNTFEVSHPTSGEHHERVNRLARNFAQAHVTVEGNIVDIVDAARALVIISLAEVVDHTEFRQLWNQFVDLAKCLLNSACGRLHGEQIKCVLLEYDVEYRVRIADRIQRYITEVKEQL